MMFYFFYQGTLTIVKVLYLLRVTVPVSCYFVDMLLSSQAKVQQEAAKKYMYTSIVAGKCCLAICRFWTYKYLDCYFVQLVTIILK